MSDKKLQQAKVPKPIDVTLGPQKKCGFGMSFTKIKAPLRGHLKASLKIFRPPHHRR